MESLISIKQMLAGNRISVPDFHRPFLWDVQFDKSKNPSQINLFLSDLEGYMLSAEKSKYYFGHFLFEECSLGIYKLIDGHQRLATISIIVSAIFSRLKAFHAFSEELEEVFEDMIKRNKSYRFSTIESDNQFFMDYVIDQIRKNKDGIISESALRLGNAFDFFNDSFATKDEQYLLDLLNIVCNAQCTTYVTKGINDTMQLYSFHFRLGGAPFSESPSRDSEAMSS
jgi:hypothetical protein